MYPMHKALTLKSDVARKRLQGLENASRKVHIAWQGVRIHEKKSL